MLCAGKRDGQQGANTGASPLRKDAPKCPQGVQRGLRGFPLQAGGGAASPGAGTRWECWTGVCRAGTAGDSGNVLLPPTPSCSCCQGPPLAKGSGTSTPACCAPGLPGTSCELNVLSHHFVRKQMISQVTLCCRSSVSAGEAE